MGQDVFKFDTGVFGPDFVAGVVVVFAGLVFGVFFEFDLFAFDSALLVELVLESMCVFIGPVEQVIDGHEYLSEV